MIMKKVIDIIIYILNKDFNYFIKNYKINNN